MSDTLKPHEMPDEAVIADMFANAPGRRVVVQLSAKTLAGVILAALPQAPLPVVQVKWDDGDTEEFYLDHAFLLVRDGVLDFRRPLPPEAA